MGRAASSVFRYGLVVVLTLLLAAGSVAGQGANNTTDDNATGNGTAVVQSDYAISLFEAMEDGHFAWSVTQLQFPAGSTVTLTYNSTEATAQHNVAISEGLDADPLPTSEIIGPNSGTSSITFVMPEAGPVTYICDVHPTEMVGTIEVGAFTSGSAAAGESIAEVGVHYLAYWVGVISFAVLFVMYGASFFLFKHGETGATTDQKDRPGFEDKTTLGGLPEYVWAIVGILVLAAAVVIFFQIMLRGF